MSLRRLKIVTDMLNSTIIIKKKSRNLETRSSFFFCFFFCFDILTSLIDVTIVSSLTNFLSNEKQIQASELEVVLNGKFKYKLLYF